MTVPPGDVELLTERHDAVDVAEGSGSGVIKGRSPWSIAWRRFKRDKRALLGDGLRDALDPEGRPLTRRPARVIDGGVSTQLEVSQRIEGAESPKCTSREGRQH